MSSLNSILGNASSGLQASQTALKVVSNNVANVNTTGYVQEQVDQSALVSGATGSGVTIADVKRVTNQYLEAASYVANGGSSSASAVAGSMDQAQTLFGDPSASGSLFSNLDSVFSAFSSLAADPSSAGNAQAVAAASQFFSQAASISQSLQGISTQADSQIGSDVSTVNQLLTQINQLNTTISQGSVGGGDVTGAQNQQGQLINQLSSLMDIKVSATSQGGVTVLASNGTALVSQSGAASLAYNANGPTGTLSITNTTGVTQPFNSITSGEIGGLLQVRNVDIPSVSSQLGSLTSGVADQLNAIHNAYSAVPPPTTLTGQTTGIDLPTAISGFSGKTTIALVNTSTEAVDHSVAIDFTAKTISVDGGAATSFTSANFLTTLNSAIASTGASASYTNGALSISSNSATDGIAIQDDATTPATNAGQGFSQFFGLNNLVSSGSITNYDTGLTATSPSGFPAGQTLTLQLTDANGNKLKDLTVTTPAGGTVADLMTALNSAGAGVGGYGSFSLDGNGALSFTPSSTGVTVSVASDNTANTAAGVSVSQLFGIGAATRSNAAATFSVRSDIVQDPSNLAVAQLNLSAGAGKPALAVGDASGADALGQAGLASLSFDAVNGVPATTSTLSDYAATISSVIGNKAAAADTAKTTQATVAANATSQLSGVEGVSIDQELINLTTYQQAYNASARMVQAANDLYTTLLAMTQN
jgi:flagellar hook-associated protein 1 FlgK